MENALSTSQEDTMKEPEIKKVKTTRQTVAAAVQPKVEELNPLLSGRNGIEERPLSSLPDDFFAQFDAVVASRLGCNIAIGRWRPEFCLTLDIVVPVTTIRPD